MRSKARLAVALLATVATIPSWVYGVDNKNPSQESIDVLAARASQAQPREQCFLYAELVQQLTELSLRQYAAGDVEKTAAMLKDIQTFAQKIHLSAANDDKRLKNAEILLRHTALRLNEMLHASSYEDRPLVEQTLAEVNQAQNQAMMLVFRK
jgi:hypothetical protein